MRFFLQKTVRALILAIVMISAGAAVSFSASDDVKLRVGYFPNITHAQAVIGMANGAFQRELGAGVKIEPTLFNAGPSVIEALFAGALDIAYIGPNPAVNGFLKSDGKALRIVAGATSSGAALVVRADAGITTPNDFHGKKIASPQLGNTQDVSLRAWLRHHGLVLSEKGGDVQVVPIRNADQLTLFQTKQIHGAWTVEPWVSRLVSEGNGRVFLEEASLWPQGSYVTAHVIVSASFLRKHPDLVEKWLRAHVALTAWINGNLPQAKAILNQELKRLTGAELSRDVLDASFQRLRVSNDPVQSSLVTSTQWAFEQGFLGGKAPDLRGIYDLSILNRILKEKGEKIIE